MVSPTSRMLSAISLGVFCRSAPSTSLIMRSRKVEPGAAVMRTRIQSDSTCVPPVTAERSPPDSADDRGRLAGDGGLVDRGDALDHLAVGGDDVAGLDQHDVADLQAGARDELVVLRVGRAQQLGLRLRALAPQRVGLGLAAALGDGFGEVGEQHGEPQPQDDLECEAEVGPARHQIANQDDGGEDRDDLEHEHHRVLDQRARIELDECRADGRDDDLGVEQGRYRHLLAECGGFHGNGSNVSSMRTRCRRSSRDARRSGRAPAPGRT